MNVEQCCFGFIHDKPIAGAVWKALVQRPFRASCVWLWGGDDAAIRKLSIGGKQQLAKPLELSMLDRKCEPGLFLGLVEDGPARELDAGDGYTTIQLRGARCMRVLDMHPKVLLPSIGVGGEIAIVATGQVRGVVLVGTQIA